MDRNKQLKKYELSILDEFIRICNKYDIKYYLAFGSALGAIRHKGFIPWDDDIDIHMFASDLIRFKEVCRYELSDKYYIQDKITDKYYYNYWTKLGLEDTTWMPKDHIVDCKYGICIDIFPIFTAKDNEKDIQRIEKYTKLMLRTSAKYYVLNSKKEKYSKFKILFHRLIPNFLNNMMYKHAMNKLRTDSDDYDKVVVCSITKDRNIYFDKSVFIGNNKLEYEKRMLFVPNELDVYLKTFYNDYMKLPPKDKRYGHDTGNDIIYDFNRSYREYFKNK